MCGVIGRILAGDEATRDRVRTWTADLREREVAELEEMLEEEE